MVPADLDEVMAIERTAFRHPWSAKFFLEELQVACARSILAQINDKIVGYVLFWLLPEEIDIHNIAVHHRVPPSTHRTNPSAPGYRTGSKPRLISSNT